MNNSTDFVRQFVARGVCFHDESVLLANKKGETHWFLPGGRVEIGEGFTDAVKREIMEELGLTCSIKRFLGVVEHSFEYYETKQYYEIGNFFEIEITNIDYLHPKSSESEMQFKWVKLSELEYIDIRPKPAIDLIKKAHSKDVNAFWASTLKN